MMATDIPARFASGFSSWRGILSTVPEESRLVIFSNAAEEIATYVAKGLDRTLAIDELADMAEVNGLDPDTAQAVLARQFEHVEPAERVPDGFEDYDAHYINGHDKAAEKKAPPLHYVDLSLALRIREWLIADLIPMFNVTLLSGEGAIGKSIALMQLAVAVVLRTPWFGLDTQIGSVLYIAAEEDEDEIRRRFEAIATHGINNSSREALRNHLRVLCFAGSSALLAEPDRNDLIKPTPLFEQIKADAIALKPKLIIVDPVADVFGGKENDRAQTRMFCTLMRGLAIDSEAAVILSSHPSNMGIQNDTGLSGSTAWHNSVRARMYFKAVQDAPEGTRQLEIKKNNYGPVSKRIIVQWSNGVYIRPEKATAYEQRSVEKKADDLFVNLIRRYEKQGRNVSENKSAPNYAPTLFAQLPEVSAAGLKKKSLIESMERLLNTEPPRITIVTEGPPSKRRSRLVVSNLAANLIPTTSQPTDDPTFDDMGWNGNSQDNGPRK